MSLKHNDLKKLWAKSGNMCAFPACSVELASEKKGNRVMGVEAHIKGENAGAARFDPNQSPEERESYENRILLCPNHHTEIDAHPDAYAVRDLLEMKARHEQQVKQNRSTHAAKPAHFSLEPRRKSKSQRKVASSSPTRCKGNL